MNRAVNLILFFIRRNHNVCIYSFVYSQTRKCRGEGMYGRGSRVGAVVRALAFHQCVPGSIPGPGVICGLSLLILYSAPRGFSPGTPVFPSPQKPTFDLI